jgi:hypothetical protein
MAGFMGLLAAQLKGKVAAYEIWNEPDNEDFWHAPIGQPLHGARQGGPSGDQAADPGAIVLAGPVSGSDYDFAQMYAAGARARSTASPSHRHVA